MPSGGTSKLFDAEDDVAGGVGADEAVVAPEPIPLFEPPLLGGDEGEDSLERVEAEVAPRRDGEPAAVEIKRVAGLESRRALALDLVNDDPEAAGRE